MRQLVIAYFFIALFGCAVGSAQDTPQNSMTTCTYTDGTSLTVRYSDANPGKKRELQNGKVWSPGDVPMLLFTETPVTVSGVQLGVGAYSMFVIPEKSKWTLIVNKNIDAKAPYDEKQDLTRAAMQTGQLPTPIVQPQVSFGHLAPKMCSLRVDFGKIGAWADVFLQK
ncbi:MAG TPA: DUF2911 domain-containing protein [Terriglobales bacterium]|nr:DUF2911 domain-containing protein [Terriglobales bacterium]